MAKIMDAVSDLESYIVNSILPDMEKKYGAFVRYDGAQKLFDKPVIAIRFTFAHPRCPVRHFFRIAVDEYSLISTNSLINDIVNRLKDGFDQFVSVVRKEIFNDIPPPQQTRTLPPFTATTTNYEDSPDYGNFRPKMKKQDTKKITRNLEF